MTTLSNNENLLINSMKLLSFPIMALNWLFIPALIWLGFSGNWSLVWFSVVVLLIGTQIGIALLPKLLLLPLVDSSNPAIRRFSVFVGLAYTNFIMAVWAWFMCGRFFGQIEDGAPIIPTLVALFTCITGPWAFLASKENDSNSNLSVWAYSLASIILILTLCFASLNIFTCIGITFFLLVPLSLYNSFAIEN